MIFFLGFHNFYLVPLKFSSDNQLKFLDISEKNKGNFKKKLRKFLVKFEKTILKKFKKSSVEQILANFD